MSNRHRTIQLLGFLGAVCLAIGSGEAGAEQPDDCPTWFPDFRCERSGRWEGFERPILAPYLFEDPFITTGVHGYYLWHDFPETSALQGGEAHAVAVQARVALTDRLALIATKDGYMWLRPDNPLLDDQQGTMNLAGGLKYALIEMPEEKFILSPVLRLEVATGSSDVLAGGSGALLMPSVAAAWEPRERLHLMADLGAQIPFDGAEHSSLIFYHLYADYSAHPRFQPFVQLSGLYYMESGDGKRPVRLKSGGTLTLDAVQGALQTGRFEGVDVLNLGSSGVDNHDIVTLGIGGHVPITENVTWSFGYERPISERRDIFKQRVTTSLSYEF